MARLVVRAKYVETFLEKKTGKWYAYYRRYGERIPIKAAIGSPEFLTEIAEIERGLRGADTPEAGTLGHLIGLFKGSEHWAGLSKPTKTSYERAFEALTEFAGVKIVDLTRPGILEIRDAHVMPARGRWMANYVVTVFGILLGFAHDRGLIRQNPLSDRVRKIRKPRGEAVQNRPWTADERDAVLAEAPPHLKLAIALAMTAGLRMADVLTVTLSSVKDGMISVRTSKRDRPVSIPVHPVLAEALAGRPKSSALTIAVNADGKPWKSGFNASWGTFRRRLEAEGKIGPGLTMHGLRHTMGTLLKEDGMDDGSIADVLGQAGTSMSRHYSKEAGLSKTTKAAVVKLKFKGNAKP